MENKEQDLPGQQQEENQKADWNVRPYLALALTIFLVFCACLAVVYFFFRFDGLKSALGTFFSIMQPIIYGIVIGYLVNPVMKKLETLLQSFFRKRKVDVDRISGLIRTVSSILAVLVFVFVVAMLVALMLPQIIDSIFSLMETFPEQANSFIVNMSNWQLGDFRFSEQLEDLLMEGVDSLQNWMKTSLLPLVQTYAVSITSGVISALNVLKNLVIGLIVAIYALSGKEKFEGQAKKIIIAIFTPKQANEIIQLFHMSNEIFGGFIKGKLLDSFIIGILCYVVLAILKMPYSALVSVVVGVTNIIPFFGPFIGAVPSALLILVVDPVKALYFIIFIIILQQVDGNIIGPKILGNSTGLSSFWVMFAILVGSGLFGVPGMLVGCPVFAVIYYLIEKAIHHFLRKKGLPLETMQYVNSTGVDRATKKLRYDMYEDDVLEEERRKK